MSDLSTHGRDRCLPARGEDVLRVTVSGGDLMHLRLLLLMLLLLFRIVQLLLAPTLLFCLEIGMTNES